jgi:hypothetical protein
MVDPKEHIYIADSENLIIVYREADHPETAQVIKFFDYVSELAEGRKFHMILNLSQASPPSSSVRHEFKKGFTNLKPRVKSFSIFFGKNFLLKITAKFVGSSIGLENYRACKSIEEGIDFINKNGDQ